MIDEFHSTWISRLNKSSQIVNRPDLDTIFVCFKCKRLTRSFQMLPDKGSFTLSDLHNALLMSCLSWRHIYSFGPVAQSTQFVSRSITICHDRHSYKVMDACTCTCHALSLSQVIPLDIGKQNSYLVHSIDIRTYNIINPVKTYNTAYLEQYCEIYIYIYTNTRVQDLIKESRA